MFLFRVLCISAVLMGCSQAHPTDAITAGIYELTVERETEACSPARAVGAMGPVAVLVRDGVVDAPVPSLGDTLVTAPRVALDPTTLHSETNRVLSDCETAWVHEEWTILESSGARFELLHTQDWQGLATCADLDTPALDRPANDCMSERRLRYELSEVCAAPCRLFLTADDELTCSC